MKLGIALGGGSVRGLAHIGVLKVLDENNIKVDCISGTSIGAVIGAAYCSGMKAEEIEKLVLSTDFVKLLDFTIPKRGLIAGRKLEKFMNKITREKTFDELIIPLSVVATDIRKSEKVVLDKGNVARAIRASIAIPPFFTPVLIEKHQLIDGGIVDPVPVSSVKEMGADKIIAVDISHKIKVTNARSRNPSNKTSFAHLFYESFVRSEYDIAREIFRKKRFKLIPKFIKNIIIAFFDKFLNPKKIFLIFSGKKVPDILLMMMQQIVILTNELTIEKLKDKSVDLVINPEFKDVTIIEFDKVKEMIKQGEEAARKALPKIKKLLSS